MTVRKVAAVAHMGRITCAYDRECEKFNRNGNPMLCDKVSDAPFAAQISDILGRTAGGHNGTG